MAVTSVTPVVAQEMELVGALVGVVVAVTLAAAHERPTRANPEKALTTVMAVDNHAASSVAPKRHGHHATVNHACQETKFSAKTLVGLVWTSASSAMTLTNANPPAMSPLASPRQACPPAAAAAAAVVIAAAGAAALAGAAHAQVAAGAAVAAEEILVVGSDAKRLTA